VAMISRANQLKKAREYFFFGHSADEAAAADKLLLPVQLKSDKIDFPGTERVHFFLISS
jgi:hypothetical protein